MVKWVIDGVKFVGLLTVMGIISQFQYGIYLNAVLVAYALWKLIND